MNLQATFINSQGDAQTLEIKEGFNLQDAYNVVANNDFATTQITLEPKNMKMQSYPAGLEIPNVIVSDIIGRHTISDILAKHKINEVQLELLLDEGTNHELEHTSNVMMAMKIAQDHLYENLQYYKKLKEAKLGRGAVLRHRSSTPQYALGNQFSFPIYVRIKNQVNNMAVMEFLNRYPQVEKVMNEFVATRNVKAGYIKFLIEKDANDQNLEAWGAKVKGTFTTPDGKVIKRYDWQYGDVEGFAEVFQYLYDKKNGYAKGGSIGGDYSDRLIADAKVLSLQDFFNRYSIDLSESYSDAKREYEKQHSQSFPVTLTQFIKSIHKEYMAIGGMVKKKLIEENINYTQTELLAPNGKLSNLTPEQYQLVRTPQFKSWFGDWENDPKNSSKVVDENGEPLVVYRGDTSSSKKGFVFKKGFNQIGYINSDRLPNQYFHYFVNNYDVALGYGQSVVDDHNDKVEYSGKGKMWQPKVTPYFLNIRNPIDITPNNPLFPTYNEYVNTMKTLFPEEMFERDKFKYPRFYGSDLTNSDLDKIFQDKLGKNYLEDKYISDYTKRQFIADRRLQDSYLFFIQFKDRYSQGDLLHKMYLSMLDNNVDGLLFLEMTHWEGEFSKNFKKYESGKLKYDYQRWTEMPKIYATLESNQIKLADGTNTTFDGKNPDIRFDKGGLLDNGKFIDEAIFIENNVNKIDGIYILSEGNKPVSSLGKFTLLGFGHYMMRDLAKELFDDYKIRLRGDFAIQLAGEIIKPAVKVAQMSGTQIQYLAIIYNGMTFEENAQVNYVFDAKDNVVGTYLDEDLAQDIVDAHDGFYMEVRVEDVTKPETILSMQFDFDTMQMTFTSELLNKKQTHKFKYGGKLPSA